MCYGAYLVDVLHYNAQGLFHCCRRLQRMGLTKQEIAQKVDERKGYTDTEDIYGEIYGNMDTVADDEVYVVATLY